MTTGSRKDITIRVTVECRLTDGRGGERWDVLSAVDDDTGAEIGDIGIYEFDAFSDFVSTITDAVANTYFERMLLDVDVLHTLEISIRGEGSTLGSAVRFFKGKHPCSRE